MLSLTDICRGDWRDDSSRRSLFKPFWDYVMAVERCYFAKRKGDKVLIVNGVECNIMSKGRKCDDTDKTFLAVGCRPRMIFGKTFDGKVASIQIMGLFLKQLTVYHAVQG